MKQTNTHTHGSSVRYEKLLQERVLVGLIYVDAVCHKAAFDDAERLFANITRLDRQLGRFRRYSSDEHRIVMPAEDSRWHVPGQPPVPTPECRLCAKQDLALLMQMVLPSAGTTTGRAA